MGFMRFSIMYIVRILISTFPDTVVVKNMITDIYLRFFVNDEPVILETIAER